ncbi:Latrophilin-3 [Stylophora pistillata]|uniref:Latrophilin-3 n=1 Tax=Stylophora pistillata TaxID=50429 RepID=A0A2B4SA71_STYPI|nr:Latrophilin-3 [Stylophora pistillata]
MGICTEKKRLLTFVMMELVLQILVQDTLSIFYGVGNFHKQDPHTISIRVMVPSTKAPAATFHTSCRSRDGVSSTQGVSLLNSCSTTQVLKSTTSNEKFPKSTPSSAEPTALSQGDHIPLTTHVKRPTTAASKGNPSNTGGYIVNTAQSSTLLENAGVDTTANDRISNSSGQDGGRKRSWTLSSDDAKVKEKQEFLKSKGCFTASFDKKTGRFIISNPAITNERIKHNQLLEDLETTLISISVTAEIISFAFLMVIRYPRSDCWFSGSNPAVNLRLKYKSVQRSQLWSTQIHGYSGQRKANLVVFVVVLRVSFGKFGHKNSLEITRKGLKAIFALLPLLGVTFLLGFFVDFHVAVEYAFVLLNSIQGILFFICHCALDNQVTLSSRSKANTRPFKRNSFVVHFRFKVLQILVQDTLSLFGPINNYRLLTNYAKPGRQNISVSVSVPSPRAPSKTLHTSGRSRAGDGVSGTQGVSFIYSSSTTKLLKSTPSNEKVPKSTPSSVEPIALSQGDYIPRTTHVKRPTAAVSKGNSCNTGGYSVNTTQSTLLEKSGVDTTGNDIISNSSGEGGGQECSKTLETGFFIFENPAITSERIKHNQVLEDLETTLVSISVTAEVISFAFLMVIRGSRSERIFVHKNLLVSLALGQVVYIVDIKILTSMKKNQTMCSIYAVIQHYLHTSLYTWMLVEGINLYLKMVKVFSFRKPYMINALLGWGIPGVIVGLVAAIQPSTYDMGTILYKEISCGTLKFTGTVDRERCWFNGSVWKFTGPALVILLANLVVFVMVLRVSFGKIGHKNYLATTRKKLKAIFALLPLLGVTFLLGFFVDFHVSVEYVFVFFNSIQGILFFICHCALDDQVRDAMKKMLRKKKRGLRFQQEPKKMAMMVHKKKAVKVVLL